MNPLLSRISVDPNVCFSKPCVRGERRYTASMKFRVVLEYDPEVESYSAVCPELPGCASAGETEEEARRGIEEAIRLYLSPTEIKISSTAKLVEVTVG